MRTQLEAVLQAVNQVLLGKEAQVRLALTCLLAEGHLLIEDLPGMGKTTLAHALAASLGLSFQRVQLRRIERFRRDEFWCVEMRIGPDRTGKPFDRQRLA